MNNVCVLRKVGPALCWIVIVKINLMMKVNLKLTLARRKESRPSFDKTTSRQGRHRPPRDNIIVFPSFFLFLGSEKLPLSAVGG